MSASAVAGHSPDRGKRAAAVRAVDEISSHSVVGLGTGSTAKYVVEELARRLTAGHLREVVGVPTSEQTAALATRLGVPLTSLDDHPTLAVAIDGADEVAPNLDVIKGLGGALLREKIVAAAARRFIIVADATKRVARLGSRAPVPIEIVPFALTPILGWLERQPGHAVLRLTSDGTPTLTDEGHWIIDYFSGPIADAAGLERMLQAVPGVIEHGLFLGLVDRVVVGEDDAVTVLDHPA